MREQRRPPELRRRLFAAVFAVGMLLTVAVSPALAYFQSDIVPAVHCMSRYTIDTHYRAPSLLKLQFFGGDSLANCTHLEIGMKWAAFAGGPIYTEYRDKPTPDPVHNGYTLQWNFDKVYCVSAWFKVYTTSFNVQTGWISC